jgi:hypothetical protein
VGWLSFFAAVAVLKPVEVGPLAGLVLACAACALTLLLVPRPTRAHVEPSPPPRWDLSLRAASAVVPVLVVTALARTLGSHLTGLIAAFPVITPVLAAFTQAQQGPQEATRLLRGMTSGFFSYAVFCYIVAVSVRALGIAASFAVAAALAVAIQAVVFLVTQRREELRRAEAAA